MGERQQLIAVVSTGTGQQQSVTGAQWSSSRPEVCTIGSDGTAIAAGTGTAVISASSAGQTASIELQIVPSVVGLWKGQAVTLSLTRISGSGPALTPVRTPSPYSLEIDQVHAVVTAKDTRYLSEGATQILTGTIDPAAAITLRGSLDVGGGDPLHIDTSSWTAQINSAGHLNGSFTEMVRFSSAFGAQVYEAKNQIIDLVRQSP
jgi:hypothetical protein